MYLIYIWFMGVSFSPQFCSRIPSLVDQPRETTGSGRYYTESGQGQQGQTEREASEGQRWWRQIVGGADLASVQQQGYVDAHPHLVLQLVRRVKSYIPWGLHQHTAPHAHWTDVLNLNQIFSLWSGLILQTKKQAI